MGLLAQLCVNTLQIGAVYVLFALGLTLVFGVMKIINFAHGQFFTLAALLIAVAMPAFTVQLGLPVWLDYLVSFMLAMIAVSLLAAALYLIGFERYLRDLIGSFILSLGLLLLLEASIVGGHWRASRGGQVLPGQVRSPARDGDATARRSAVSLAFTVALDLLFSAETWEGPRAVAEDREAADVEDPTPTSFDGFMIGWGLAGVADRWRR